MARIITFANKKGGSGKTTVVVNLGAVLGKLGQRVLIMDLDPQSHATLISGIDTYEKKRGIGSVIRKSFPLTEAIVQGPQGLYDIIPSYHKDEPYVMYGLQRDFRNFIDPVADLYDFILIDTPPSREDILIFSLSFSTELMIPLPLQFLAMEGLAELIGLLVKISKKINPDLKLTAVIPVMTGMRTNHAAGVCAQLEKIFNDKLLQTGIRQDVKIADSAWNQLPVILYSPHTRASEDFLNLAQHILS